MTPRGVLVVDKPRGPTSHDVVAGARRRLRTREIGHAGTLDPMATGVLVLAVGEATKLVPWLTAADKEYEALVMLGAETDSLDADGKIVREASVPPEVQEALARVGDGAPASGALADALAGERARREQLPPAVSAIRIAGERAHDLARAGREVALPPRAVTVRSLEVLGATRSALRVRLVAAKGYYVRAFARDLGAALGTAAHLGELRRLRSGDFTLADAAGDALMPLEAAARRCLPVTVLDEAGVAHARAGRRVPASCFASSAVVAAEGWLTGAGEIVAVGARDGDGTGRVLRGFVPRPAG